MVRFAGDLRLCSLFSFQGWLEASVKIRDRKALPSWAAESLWRSQDVTLLSLLFLPGPWSQGEVGVPSAGEALLAWEDPPNQGEMQGTGGFSGRGGLDLRRKAGEGL